MDIVRQWVEWHLNRKQREEVLGKVRLLEAEFGLKAKTWTPHASANVGAERLEFHQIVFKLRLAMDDERRCWGLVRRRLCLAPTWRGWLALVFICAVVATGGVLGIYPFLAVTDPVPGGLLVVEGWAPDYALEAAIAEFNHNHYEKVYVIGGPLEHGEPLSEYRSLAELGAATLVKLGLSTNVVQAVPAPLVRQDRTYTAAVSLGKWWSEHGLSPTSIHLISEGPHARRSRLMFEKALGKGVKVGVTAVPAREYDEKRWWRSSAGVRNVIGEALAYGYARVVFREARETK